ncbi:MAG TPA: DUF3037 domain-containing protein [Blastocatellia bacterium]|nr:DUF3037 domain-containing protein [Blastocatellia bacterium]
MNERPFLYQIIRYVPDLRRMEPKNIGVIVQGQSALKLRLWAHFRPGDDKPDFDYANFRKWREFFEEEVNGPQIALFQPPRHSPEFLEYLQSRCRGNYIVTRPLHVAMRTDNIEEVTQHLYETIVRSPEEEPEPAEQPVRRFRERLEARKLHKNPLLRRDEYVALPSGEAELFHWQYNKNHGSDELVLIEPVQWLGKIRLTQLELEHVLSAAKKIRETNFHAHLIVVMDQVVPPSERAKDATKRLYENYVEGMKILKQESDEVISKVEQTEHLVNRIESDLMELLQHPA